MTPILQIFDHHQALEFYIGWLDFQLDWVKPADEEAASLQTSRGEIVLQLEVQPPNARFISKARAEVVGLSAYHRMLMRKQSPFACPALRRASWDNRVLEMEIIDPFGNHLIFYEACV